MNVNNVLLNFEKKIDRETNFRIENEIDLKNYIDQKFINIYDELKNEEKLSLEREKRMMN
jgi:hypothetical protein